MGQPICFSGRRATSSESHGTHHPLYFADNPRVLEIVAVFTMLILLPTLFLGVYQSKLHGRYSPYDETTHISYAWSVAHGRIPAKGDAMEQPILDDWACHGQPVITTTPGCGVTAPLSEYPAGGLQYNYIHPPVYYAITGFSARLISHILPSISFIHAARLIEIVWIIAGIILCYLALKSWGIRKLYALSAAAIIPYIPVISSTGSAVNNDAPALACGAAILWSMARVYRHNRIDCAPVIFALLFCMMKGTFAFGFFGFAIILFIFSIAKVFIGDRRSGIDGILVSCGTAAAALLCVVGWSRFQALRGTSSWVNPNLASKTPVTGSPIVQLMTTFLSGLNLAQFDGLRGLESQPSSVMWIALLSVILTGAVAFLYFQHDNDLAHSLLLATTALTMLLFPTFIQLREYLSNGHIIPTISARYGLYIIPLVLCCWGLTIQQRRSRILAICIPLFAIACTFYAVLTATNLN